MWRRPAPPVSVRVDFLECGHASIHILYADGSCATRPNSGHWRSFLPPIADAIITYCFLRGFCANHARITRPWLLEDLRDALQREHDVALREIQRCMRAYGDVALAVNVHGLEELHFLTRAWVLVQPSIARQGTTFFAQQQHGPVRNSPFVRAVAEAVLALKNAIFHVNDAATNIQLIAGRATPGYVDAATAVASLKRMIVILQQQLVVAQNPIYSLATGIATTRQQQQQQQQQAPTFAFQSAFASAADAHTEGITSLHTPPRTAAGHLSAAGRSITSDTNQPPAPVTTPRNRTPTSRSRPRSSGGTRGADVTTMPDTPSRSQRARASWPSTNGRDIERSADMPAPGRSRGGGEAGPQSKFFEGGRRKW